MAECLLCGAEWNPLLFVHNCQRIDRPSTIPLEWNSSGYADLEPEAMATSLEQWKRPFLQSDEDQVTHVSGYLQEAGGTVDLIPESLLTSMDQWKAFYVLPDGDQSTPVSGYHQVMLTPGYLQEAQGPEPVEPEKPVYVWTWSHDGKGMAGRVAFPLAELPRDRQAMRQMLHERLQGLGDALMAEWECLIAEPVPLTEEQMAKRAAQSPYTDPPEQYSLGPAPHPGKAVP